MSAPAPTAQFPVVTTGQIARMLSARLVGPGDIVLRALDGLEQAGDASLSFIRSPRYAHMWGGSRAAAALVSEGLQVPGHDPDRRSLIFVPDADLALVTLLESFAPKYVAPPPGAHASSVIDPGAAVATSAAIGPMCVVGPGAHIGPGAVLHAQVFVGAGARVGEGSILHPRVTVLDRCVVGKRCILWPGVAIGTDGFGFRPGPGSRGEPGPALIKVPHAGWVEIDDDVEIGANSCIDRGKLGPTRVGAGTKLDNLVQIAHNCIVGRGVIICGVTGVGGSTSIGDYAMIGGQVGIADNVAIGDRARVGSGSGVMQDVPGDMLSNGSPAFLGNEHLRTRAALRRLPDLIKTVRAIAKRVGVPMHRAGPSDATDA